MDFEKLAWWSDSPAERLSCTGTSASGSGVALEAPLDRPEFVESGTTAPKTHRRRQDARRHGLLAWRINGTPAMDIAEWLESLGLEEYALTFAENRIGADVLSELTDHDLRDLGIIALGDRKRLLAATASLNKPTGISTEPTSEPFAAPDGERRQVTVLFADIAGFTALSERIACRGPTTSI